MSALDLFMSFGGQSIMQEVVVSSSNQQPLQDLNSLWYRAVQGMRLVAIADALNELHRPGGWSPRTLLSRGS